MPAVYKGQKVAVYTVDKTEISLSRQDLIELVNVGCFLIPCVLLGRIAVCSTYVDGACCYGRSSVVFRSVCHDRGPCENR